MEKDSGLNFDSNDQNYCQFKWKSQLNTIGFMILTKGKTEANCLRQTPTIFKERILGQLKYDVIIERARY